MFLKNGVVYIQFHPVVYMVKLNIEMSMASLVVRLAQGKTENDMDTDAFGSSNHESHCHSGPHGSRRASHSRNNPSLHMSNRQKRGTSMMQSIGLGKIDSDESLGGIECRTDVNVVVEKLHKGEGSMRSSTDGVNAFGDDIPLRKTGDLRIIERSV